MAKYKLIKFAKAFGLVLFALVFYFAGYLIGHKNLVFEKNYKPAIANTEFLKPREIDFSSFWKAWEKINQNFVGKTDSQSMVYGAIAGMVNSLKDPYSAFMEPSQSKDFLNELSGSVEGIGAEISIVDGRLTIISPLADSPAKKVGLKPNDQVLKIDDEETDNMPLGTAIGKIRGKAGTKVSLTIMRSGWTQPQQIEIQRAKVAVNSVEWEFKEKNVAYVKISQFGEDTTTLLRKAADEINAKNPAGIIIDVRDNPGGYLEAAVDAASLFMNQGVVVKEQYKDGHVEEEKTTLSPVLLKYKVVVLTNGGSASASEILAGALQDVGRAKLVGEKTFGKGSVQTLEDLGQGMTLRLTIAKWLTPKDRAIDKIGIEPDVKVVLTEEDAKANRDPQLEKALELAK